MRPSAARCPHGAPGRSASGQRLPRVAGQRQRWPSRRPRSRPCPGTSRQAWPRRSGSPRHPADRWRRSIQTVVSPSRLAGTWSWYRLWATCRIRSRGTADPLEQGREVRLVGLVRADLLGGHDPVEVDAEPPCGGREQVVVAVRQDAEPEAPLERRECRGRVREGRPIDDRSTERLDLRGRRFGAELPEDAAQAGGQHVPIAKVRTRFGGGLVAGVSLEHRVVVDHQAVGLERSVGTPPAARSPSR